MIESIQEYVYRLICKCYAILYKELEHQQILVSGPDPGTCPLWLSRENCIMIKIQIHMKTGLNSEFLLLLCGFQVIDSETPTIS